MPEIKKITIKHKLFVKQYVIDFNATRAYRDVYKCSDRAATASSRNLLANTCIQELVKKEIERVERDTEVTKDRIVLELARIAFLDIREAFDKEGRLIDVHNLSERVSRSIGGIEISRQKTVDSEGNDIIEDSIHKLKIIDKSRALEMLGKHLMMFTDKVDHNHNGKIDHEHTHTHKQELDYNLISSKRAEINKGNGTKH